MGDLIDRQALLRQIDIDSEGEPGYYGDTWKFIDTIKNLPSAIDKNAGTELSTNLAEVGTDCISRQAAIDGLRGYLVGKRCPDDGTFTCRLIENEVINKLPSAQPEIVRCKDCKHYKEWESEFTPNAVVTQCMADNFPIHKAIPDGWFCAGAERRTNEE